MKITKIFESCKFFNRHAGSLKKEIYNFVCEKFVKTTQNKWEILFFFVFICLQFCDSRRTGTDIQFLEKHLQLFTKILN